MANRIRSHVRNAAPRTDAPVVPHREILDVTAYARPSGSETDALVAYVTRHRPDLTTFRERLAEALALADRFHVVYRPAPYRKT